MTQIPLIPRQVVPDLTVPLVGGGHWTLANQTPDQFTLIVVYRGLHCPICSHYLADLKRKVDNFQSRGVDVFVLSSDDAERADQAKEEWELNELKMGYGLTLEKAREWGLYISSGRGKTSAGIEEPSLFVEPGIFLVRPDQTLYFATVQTMPFARPSFGDILKAIDFVVAKDYPARGEVTEIGV
jgi:peroxiredoxin